MLEGRQFILFTGHKPLTQALFITSDPLTPRQCWQLSYIAEHTSDICHVAGLDNVVADMLSRPPELLAPSPVVACVNVHSRSQTAARQEGKSNSFPPSLAMAVAAFCGRLDFLTIAANQLTCPDTLTALRTPVLSIQPVVIDGVIVLCYTARGMTRPLITPGPDRKQVFAAPRMRSSLVRMRSSLVRMRSSLVVRASDCQCTSCNGPGFDPSIRPHSGI
jgi:hypothetical protein